MNLKQLKKNIGWRVQIEPPAIHLDALGRELPMRNEDWILTDVADEAIRLDEATILGLMTWIGKDSIHHFSQNVSRSVPGGLQYGALLLGLQMTVQSDVITYRSCPRPGERVAPPPPALAEALVELQHPVRCGLQQQLLAAGYQTAWCREARLRTLVSTEGWEVVRVRDPNGIWVSFRHRGRDGDAIFIRRK